MKENHSGLFSVACGPNQKIAKKATKNIRGSKRTEFLESYGIDSGLWFHTEGPDSLSDCHAGSVWLLIPGRIAALKAYQIEEIENFLIFAVLLRRSRSWWPHQSLGVARASSVKTAFVYKTLLGKNRTSQKN
jgi:hypothetical protein